MWGTYYSIAQIEILIIENKARIKVGKTNGSLHQTETVAHKAIKLYTKIKSDNDFFSKDLI